MALLNDPIPLEFRLPVDGGQRLVRLGQVGVEGESPLRTASGGLAPGLDFPRRCEAQVHLGAGHGQARVGEGVVGIEA